MSFPTYFEAFDIRALLADYPVGDAFTARYRTISRDELFALQDRQFRKLMARGWQIPFYQRLWGEAGIEPGDIAGLADITKLPVYDKSHIMASVAAHPPLGDFAGLGGDGRAPQVLHTTSGTTGRPQPLLFGPKGREVINLLTGRMYRWQGMRPADVVHSVYGHGMINGGHFIREAVTHFTNSLFLSAGTGIETRSVQQVGLMADFGVTVVVGFVDYIRKLAEVAKAEGLFERIPLRMIIGHLGTEDRSAIEAAWGHDVRAYDWYGVGDTGSIAGEGPDRDGLYVWEDAQYLELLDVDSGAPVAPGGMGDMVVTCLFKNDIAPCIRFNTHDVTHELDGRGEIAFRRIAGFKGRSDNMVKLRGINVFPHAVAALIENRADLTGEYLCRIRRDGAGRDEMEVTLESRGGSNVPELADILRRGLGVEVVVTLCEPGGTAAVTQVETRQKPIRLIDERAAP